MKCARHRLLQKIGGLHALTRIIFSFCLVFTLGTSAKARIKVGIVLQETRSDRFDEFHNNIKDMPFATLHLTGDGLAQVEFQRTVIKVAADNTGLDLVDHQTEDDEGFDELWNRGLTAGANEAAVGGGLQKTEYGWLILRLSLTLKKNAAQARTIRELSGEVDLFAPKRDPDSIVEVKDFQKLRGASMISRVLSAAGIELNTITKVQAEALDRSKGLDGQQCGKGQLDAADEKPHVILHIKNSKQQLVALEFQDKNGHKIEVTGMIGRAVLTDDWKIFEFRSDLPDAARLVIYLATPKSVIKVPFTFTNLALPSDHPSGFFPSL
jgi:hypothetical protein